MKSDIVFLAGLFPKDREEEINRDSKGGIQNAANALQWNMADALDSMLQKPIKMINAPYLGSFPFRYRKMFIKGGAFSHSDGAEDISVSFCNLTYYKYLSIYHHVRHALKKWMKQGNVKEKAVVAYAMTGNNIKLLRYIKKRMPDIRTVLVVPDLPEFMNPGQEIKRGIFYFLKQRDMRLIYDNLCVVDKFILLTEAMNDRIGADQLNYTVMEGIAPEFPDMANKKMEYKTLLYTGGLEQAYGVIELCEAFAMTEDSTFRLILCGSGSAEPDLRKLAEKDKRIILKGLLPRAEAMKLQQQSDVLVNPRRDDMDFTRYSFPSKVLEYMASGTPVMMRYLSGIPQEYMNYCFEIKAENKGQFASEIQSVLLKSTDELETAGKKAKDFVEREKNSEAQGKNLRRLFE